jgi:hypothetical protein
MLRKVGGKGAGIGERKHLLRSLRVRLRGWLHRCHDDHPFPGNGLEDCCSCSSQLLTAGPGP